MKKIILSLIISLFSLSAYSQFIDVHYLDTITFEEPYEFLSIDTSAQNIWQIGVPNKVYFDSAYSYDQAIVTDTVNYYPINNTSYFDLKISYENFPSYEWLIFLEITHKFDTDSLKDGGFISVSYDYGETWTNIINDESWNYDVSPWPGDYSGINLYTEDDLLFNGEKGFSGRSDGWIVTEFGWHMMPVSPPGLIEEITELEDTTIIRFTFVSDSLDNNKEGWLIDHIRLVQYDLMGSVGDFEKIDFSIYPNPIIDEANISFDKFNRQLNLKLYTLSGQLIKNENYYNSRSIKFARDNIKPGTYILKITTEEKEVGIQKINFY